jgi:Short C-terminal domain
VIGRSEVRKTPLGESLAELGGRRITRYLWKELERLGDTAAFHARADRVLAGWSGDGYTAVWALTTSELVALTEQAGASRLIPLGQIEGVVRPSDETMRVLVDGAAFAAFRTPDAEIAAFARAVADRAGAPLGGVDMLFSADGPVSLTGTPTTITGQYLGGYGDMAAGPVAVVFDDVGVHLAPAAKPWWQTCALAWSDVREVRVEGHEETRRRVTATRMLAVGLLALAIPKDEEFSHAYVTVAATDGDLVVRIDHARPQELKARLGEVLRRPAAAADGGQPTAGAAADLADQVARLGELHARGVLTDEEFAAAKRKLLGL